MLFLIKTIVYFIVSTGLAWLTRSSLRNYRSHGFYRFFAFQAILILILLNVDYWFRGPFSTYQLVSWPLLIICTYLGIHGLVLLRRVGKPNDRRADPSLISFEKTSQLVTDGVYRYIRHPLYSSLLFLTWGAFFKHPSWEGTSLAVIATILLTMTAKMEEAENISFFGEEYRIYMKRTKLFIPFIF
jgi:protein-S-isoprenylcysteine O-methyltransferase Ste14